MKKDEKEKKPTDIHTARVKKIIAQGIEKMKKGESAVFPISELIEAETNRLNAEINAEIKDDPQNKEFKSKRSS